jgi:hypothetical protein
VRHRGNVVAVLIVEVKEAALKKTIAIKIRFQRQQQQQPQPSTSTTYDCSFDDEPLN